MISDNALRILNERYFVKDKDGKIVEDWEDLCTRVSSFISKDDKNYDDIFFDIIYDLRFVPNSPCLMNAGLETPMLNACFVLPIRDSMESILGTLTDAAMIHKAGGGVGYSFSHLRPKNSVVQSTSGVASGPVSFMRMYNGVTDEIKQGGRRRGANMGILRVDHPDIKEFITCKRDTSKITNFNISVSATDNFMKAVKENRDYMMVDPYTGDKKKQRAKEIFDLIVENAWKTGEPGLFFVDTVNKAELYKDDPIEACNPCGESELRNYESCNLGSLNLNKYWDGEIKWGTLESDVHTAVRFLDNMISNSKYPLGKIEEETIRTRKVGLGVMGFADLLINMGIPYGSKESFEIADKVMQFIHNSAMEYSEVLAQEKGKSEVCEKLGLNRRNLWLTICAPTGTISMIADCSSGIEPLFAVGFKKTVMDGKEFDYFHPEFERLMAEEGIEINKDLKNKIFSNGSIQDIKEIPKKIRDIFVTSYDVSPEDHVRMQATFQKHLSGGCSKTINMPESATKNDVAKAFMMAYDLGCKGITVYRDGSRPNQVLSTKKEKVDRKVFNRTAVMSGTTEKIDTPLGNLLLTLNRNSHGDLGEVIINIGKSGADVNALCEALGRIASVSLQYGVPSEKLGKQLKGIQGEERIIHINKKYSSIPDIIGHKMSNGNYQEKTLLVCPVCESRLHKAEGCNICKNCGFSKC